MVMGPPGGVGVEQVGEPAAQLGGEARARCHRSLGLAEGVEGIKRFSHRRSLRRLGGTPGGRARAAPRWRGRCGRGARPPRGRTGRRGSASVSADRWWAPSRPSTSWATAASSCASHGSSSGAGSSATARRLRSSRACRRQWSTSLWRATPISHAVVSCGTRPLLHGGHRGEERLGGEVLGHGRSRRTAAPGTRTPPAAPSRTARAGPAPGRTRSRLGSRTQIIVATGAFSDVCARKRPHAERFRPQTLGAHRAGLAWRPSKRPAGRTWA